MYSMNKLKKKKIIFSIYNIMMNFMVIETQFENE